MGGAHPLIRDAGLRGSHKRATRLVGIGQFIESLGTRGLDDAAMTSMSRTWAQIGALLGRRAYYPNFGEAEKRNLW
jgi:hypothetical protein